MDYEKENKELKKILAGIYKQNRYLVGQFKLIQEDLKIIKKYINGKK